MLAFRKNLCRAVSLAAMFVLPAIAAVPAVDAQGSDSIPTLRVNASEITIGGRVQTQFNTTTADGEPPTEWLLRRVRIAAKVRINELVSGRVEPDFAGSGVSIRDAFLRLSFAPAAELTVGQAFRPVGLLAQTSSTLILPIERGARIRGVSAPEHDNLVGGLEYAGRDVGIQLRGAPSGAPLGLAYGVGVFAGPDRKEAGSAAREQFTARVTIEPLRGVRLGGGWSSRVFAAADSLEPRGVAARRGSAWEADVEYGDFAPGLHLLGEVAAGDFDPLSGRRFRAAQTWLGFRSGQLGSRLAFVEPVFRASYGEVDPDPAAPEPVGGLLLTPGVNLYFDRLNRVMLNYDVWSPDGEGNRDGSFKAMFQMVF